MLKKLLQWVHRKADNRRTDSYGFRTLYIDVSVLAIFDAGTGIQRVVRSVYGQMTAFVPHGWRIIPVAANKSGPYRELPLDFMTMTDKHVLSTGPVVQPQRDDIFLGLDFAAHILPRKRAILRRWRHKGVFCAFVLYDLLPLAHPRWFRRPAIRHYRRWLNTIVDNAHLVVSISEQVRRDYEDYLKTLLRRNKQQARTAVVSLGWDMATRRCCGAFSGDFLGVFPQLGKGCQSVLMVGTIEPRKGYDVALAAFETIWEDPEASIALIIVGRPGWKTEALQRRIVEHPQTGRRLWWLPDVSDEELTQLYSQVDGILFASHAEGYGLPVGEALAHDKPVLARDLPVLRELFSDYINYFESDDTSSLAEHIKLWLASTDTPVKKAAPPLKTWACSTQEFFTVLGVSDRNLERP